MGGASSKLDGTDWARATGKLESRDDTFDGAPPTPAYGVYYVTKRAYNQREFDVTDSDQNLIYTTRAVPGTIACFDVLGRGMNEYLLRVNVDIARRYWIVYRYGIPTFPGQLADQTATDKLEQERLQQQTDGGYSAQGSSWNDMSMMNSDTNPTPLLFKKGCITVSWSRYMAVASLYGPPTVEMLLQQQAISPSPSKKGSRRREDEMRKYDDDEDETEGSIDDIFLQAAAIAQRMKTHRSQSDDENEDDEDVAAAAAVDGEETNDSHDETDTKPLEVTDADGGGGDMIESDRKAGDKDESMPSLQTSQSTEEEASAGNSASPETGDTDTNEQATVGGKSQHDDVTAEPDANSLPPPSLGGMKSPRNTKSSAPVVADDSETTTTTTTTTESDGTSIPGQQLPDDGSPEILPSASSTSTAASESSTVSSRTSSSKSRFDRQRRSLASFTGGSKKNVKKWIRQQHESFRETSHKIKVKSKALLESQREPAINRVNPLEGVIHLDRPLLLCQEIYTKIIGNHQTSLVSRETVLELLKQDMAQHIKEHPDDEHHGGDPTEQAEDPLLSAEDGDGLVFQQLVDNKEGEETEEESQITTIHEDGNGTASSTDQTDAAVRTTTQGSVPKSESEEQCGGGDAGGGGDDRQRQPLVGYWMWENTWKTHKMKMHVAEGSDLALHVVLAIVVNNVRYERNAIAMTI